MILPCFFQFPYLHQFPSTVSQQAHNDPTTAEDKIQELEDQMDRKREIINNQHNRGITKALEQKNSNARKENEEIKALLTEKKEVIKRMERDGTRLRGAAANQRI